MALETVRESFGWMYAAYWEVDEPREGCSTSRSNRATITEEFRRATHAAAILPRGRGSAAAPGSSRDLVFAPDLSQMPGCPRATMAKRFGIASALAIPIQVGGRVVGVMDFLTRERIEPSENRLEVMRSVGRLVSTALERVERQSRMDEAKRDLEDEGQRPDEGGRRRGLGRPDASRSRCVATTTWAGSAPRWAEMITDLKVIIGQVVESTRQFAEGSQVIAESATYLSESSQNQAATVEEMSASIDQLGRAITDISRNAEAARSQAEETSRLARQGGEAVEQAIEAMSLIKKSSEQVSDITQVIGEIASQTNLLALNAAIEAARAGEHGLGFAVVADEVRKLAERSSAAAKEITSLIKESTRRVNDGARSRRRPGSRCRRSSRGVEETAERIA